MRILVIADPHIPVPPRQYGGTERMVAFFCAAMQQRGHSIQLLAATGSSHYGGRTFIHHAPSRAILSRAFRKMWFQVLSLWAARGVDAVVNFGRLDYLESVLRTSKPLVCCFQNPLSQTEVDWLRSRRVKQLALVGVSAAQIRGLQPTDLFSVVHNGTDVDRLHFQKTPNEPPYLVFLGRVTQNKGADTAIDVAQRSGMKLKLAGNVSDEPGGREFFETQIRPRLGEGVEYAGPVDDEAKQRLLGGATAFLFPIRWPEPFGIVMAESLACGTPTIATRCASTPEVVQHGKTGFLCDSVDEMVAAVARVRSLDRGACRRDAEARFSAPVMADQYLRVIERLVGSGGASNLKN